MYNYFFETTMTVNELTRVQNTDSYKALRNAHIQPNNISFWTYNAPGRKCQYLAIDMLCANSTYDSGYLLNLANIYSLQQEYGLPIMRNKLPENIIFIATDNLAEHADISMNNRYAVMFKIDAVWDNDCSDITFNVLRDIERMVTDYPLVNDIAEDKFFAMEHEIKRDYLCNGWLYDAAAEYFPLEWNWLQLHDNGKLLDGSYDNPYEKIWELLEERSINDNLIDNWMEHCNVVNCAADMNIQNTASKKLAMEVKRIIRNYALQLRDERINGWQKNWLALPVGNN